MSQANASLLHRFTCVSEPLSASIRRDKEHKALRESDQRVFQHSEGACTMGISLYDAILGTSDHPQIATDSTGLEMLLTASCRPRRPLLRRRGSQNSLNFASHTCARTICMCPAFFFGFHTEPYIPQRLIRNNLTIMRYGY